MFLQPGDLVFVCNANELSRSSVFSCAGGAIVRILCVGARDQVIFNKGMVLVVGEGAHYGLSGWLHHSCIKVEFVIVKPNPRRRLQSGYLR
jgi:hypothetical protein